MVSTRGRKRQSSEVVPKPDPVPTPAKQPRVASSLVSDLDWYGQSLPHVRVKYERLEISDAYSPVEEDPSLLTRVARVWKFKGRLPISVGYVLMGLKDDDVLLAKVPWAVKELVDIEVLAAILK